MRYMQRGYQRNYAAGRQQMYDQSSRLKKAERMIKLLKKHFKTPLINLKLLDVGASTGIIDDYLANHFKEVTGVDIDTKAIDFAKHQFVKKNLKFLVADAMQLPFSASSFDAIICAHIYEHVPNSQKLFEEMYRVLKPGGVVYLAAVHNWWPVEPHHNLPFLALLPKKLANIFLRITHKGSAYYENILSPLQIQQLTHKFRIYHYNHLIFRHPEQFGFEDTLLANPFFKPVVWLFSFFSDYFSPTLFWILEK